MFLEWENNSGKLQIISGKFQNNTINDNKQISLSHVITKGTGKLNIKRLSPTETVGNNNSKSCIAKIGLTLGKYQKRQNVDVEKK